MIRHIQDAVIGHIDDFGIEHRCYNSVCIAAGFGCIAASIFNYTLQLPLPITLVTAVIGIIYLGLYVKSRREKSYQPVLWLYILVGLILLIMTWVYNGGINGADTFVSMVALVAVISVSKAYRLRVVLTVFFPAMSVLFLVEFLFPELILGYTSVEQRFTDMYLTFVVSTIVIYAISALILQSHDNEKKHLDESNRLLEEKMEILHRTNLELEEALAKVKTLSGLLPICSACHKIRDDQGYWNQIESYIQKHSKAAFSHSICPDCARKLYPDIDISDH